MCSCMLAVFIGHTRDDSGAKKFFHTIITNWRWHVLQLAMACAPIGDDACSNWRWWYQWPINNHKKAVQTSLERLAPLVQKAHYVQCAL